MTDAQWAGLARALERPEWLEDERFKTTALRDENIDDRLALIQEVLATRSSAELMEKLEAAGVPCAPVIARSELMENPQVRANAIVVESDHPQAGRLRQARAAARFEGTPTAIRRGAPGLGEHTDEILTEAGLSGDEIAELRDQRVVGG
jgi:crotonobetainyl-CoA:carnitine CoA-transferase CaiB-like acyl-CoA transferase